MATHLYGLKTVMLNSIVSNVTKALYLLDNDQSLHAADSVSTQIVDGKAEINITIAPSLSGHVASIRGIQLLSSDNTLLADKDVDLDIDTSITPSFVYTWFIDLNRFEPTEEDRTKYIIKN